MFKGSQCGVARVPWGVAAAERGKVAKKLALGTSNQVGRALSLQDLLSPFGVGSTIASVAGGWRRLGVVSKGFDFPRRLFFW